MEQMFHSARDIERFIKTANFSNVNLDIPTMGGTIWWENIVELYGWKVQQHKVVSLKSHYRILDHNGIRRAWVMDPEDIYNALEDYEAAKKFD